MTPSQMAAARVSDQIVHVLAADYGVTLTGPAVERVRELIAVEFAGALAPPGEGSRVYGAAYRRGLRPDPE